MTIKSFRTIVLSTILSVTFMATNFQNQAISMERNIQTPDEELILAVKGYKKTGAAVLVGMINPIVGAMIACAPNDEKDRDLVKIQKALDNGADVNYRDTFTWTPLLYAAYGGYPKIAQFLLENGADKTLAPTERNIQDWRGYTPVKVADYYLNDYTKHKQTCEPDMIEYYDELIQRYAQLVEILK
ncbi:MAG: ankyrin repeat domain-containing protein [Alphaproteobacteria bacterium]|nr:ankyrin repeat domain-containing protein [Alphaproteobacteria bacterium]